MIHFPRLVPIALTLSCAALIPQARAANNNDTMQLVNLLQGSEDYLLHGAQGYLGVGIRDIDTDRATALKLKQAQGAEIVYLDQDAPASKAGLKLHDVILQMNGQPVEGVEQLRRMLHETPPGRAVNFSISRDGQMQTLSLQLADRAKLEQDARAKMFVVPEPDDFPALDAMAPPRADGAKGFFSRSMTLSNGVEGGAVVHPISPQLADYFGDKEGSGLLVESVEDNSPAAAAGLKAGDVILKVNEGIVGTRSEWVRAIRASKGKPVQVTVLRNKREQVLSMQPSDKKSDLEMPLPDDAEPFVAMLRDGGSEFSNQLGAWDQLNAPNADGMKLSFDTDAQSKQAREMAKQAQKMMKGFDGKKLQEQIKKGQEDMQRSMHLWRDNLGTIVLDTPEADEVD